MGAKILEDGFNIMLSIGSGLHIQDNQILLRTADGINDRSTLMGSINGSRLHGNLELTLSSIRILKLNGIRRSPHM